MSVINNANENYFRHCSQNSLSNSFLYLKHVVENIFFWIFLFYLLFSILHFVFKFIFSRSVNVYSLYFFRIFFKQFHPRISFFFLIYILAKIQIKRRGKKSAKGKSFLFFCIQSNNYQSEYVRKSI